MSNRGDTQSGLDGVSSGHDRDTTRRKGCGRENMKQLLAHNQEEQEKRFDAKRCRATPYAVGDLVLIKVTSSECPNGDEPEATTKMARSVPGGEGPGKRSLRFLKQNFTHILF